MSQDVTPGPAAATPLATDAWRVALPALLLAATAVAQMVFASTGTLSPWKGGGFGMFSTIDAPAFRDVRIFVEAPGRSEMLGVPASLLEPAAKAAAWPTEGRLEHLAQLVAERETRRGTPAASVRVDVVRRYVDDEGVVATATLNAVTRTALPKATPSDP